MKGFLVETFYNREATRTTLDSSVFTEVHTHSTVMCIHIYSLRFHTHAHSHDQSSFTSISERGAFFFSLLLPVCVFPVLFSFFSFFSDVFLRPPCPLPLLPPLELIFFLVAGFLAVDCDTHREENQRPKERQTNGTRQRQTTKTRKQKPDRETDQHGHRGRWKDNHTQTDRGRQTDADGDRDRETAEHPRARASTRVHIISRPRFGVRASACADRAAHCLISLCVCCCCFLSLSASLCFRFGFLLFFLVLL